MILTTRHKNCARCEAAAQFARETAKATGQMDVKHHIEKGNERHWGRAVAAPAKPFSFQYDAITGVFVVEALEEKAKAERKAAKAYRMNAEAEAGLKVLYEEQARLADNRAQLLEDAAKEIHATYHQGLVEDFANAIPD